MALRISNIQKRYLKRAAFQPGHVIASNYNNKGYNMFSNSIQDDPNGDKTCLGDRVMYTISWERVAVRSVSRRTVMSTGRGSWKVDGTVNRCTDQ